MATTTAQHRAYRNRKANKGVCVTCTKPSRPGRGLCQGCQDRVAVLSKTRRDKYLSLGLCSKCGALENAYRGMCLRCRVNTLAHGLGAVMIAKLKEQDGRCVYTGELVVPGVNASIDHIMPTSRGGRHSAENLQWTTKLINRMKQEMTHDEFLAKCRQITEMNRG